MTVQQSLEEVVLAMERLGQVFGAQITQARENGRSEEDLARLLKGADAMRDSAGLYLAWARHYISELGQTDDHLDSDEMFNIEEA